MDPITASVVGGIGGGVLSGIGSFFGGKSSAETSAEAAKKIAEMQIGWERERATNSHQWEIEDLKKAGLNPILSAGGSGASTGGINPPMPDTSGINSAYAGAGAAISQGIQNAFGNTFKSQEIKNDTDRVLNETKETNSNLSLKAAQIEEILQRKLNYAVERGWIKQKTATEITNRQKIKTDMELAQSQIILNEQLRGKYQYEMDRIEHEIELLKEEKKMYPGKQKQQQIENDLSEKENQLYYIKETVNELTKIGSMGLAIYGTVQADKAISAYKANSNRTSITNSYNNKGKLIGTREQFYK